MGALKPWHILVLAAVLILLFGAKRLPGAARSLGQSMRIIKTETQALRDDAPVDRSAEPVTTDRTLGHHPAAAAATHVTDDASTRV